MLCMTVSSLHRCPPGHITKETSQGKVCVYTLCASRPCRHGTCVAHSPSRYSCRCSEGYRGRHCEVALAMFHNEDSTTLSLSSMFAISICVMAFLGSYVDYVLFYLWWLITAVIPHPLKLCFCPSLYLFREACWFSSCWVFFMCLFSSSIIIAVSLASLCCILCSAVKTYCVILTHTLIIFPWCLFFCFPFHISGYIFYFLRFPPNVTILCTFLLRTVFGSVIRAHFHPEILQSKNTLFL